MVLGCPYPPPLLDAAEPHNIPEDGGFRLRVCICIHTVSRSMFGPVRNGGAAAADPSLNGQRWKRKMEAANLRAAREAFRERNPLVRVGYTNDSVSVLKVIVFVMVMVIDVYLTKNTKMPLALGCVFFRGPR